MHILFLTDGLFPFQVGGMQKHSTILIKKLVEKGVWITVVHPGGSSFNQEALSNVFGSSENLKFIHVPFIDSGKLPGHYVRANRRYSKDIFEKVKSDLSLFDLVYVQGFCGHEFFKQKRIIGFKIPIFLNLHGFEMYQYAANIKTKLAYSMLRREAIYNLKQADYVYSFGAKLNAILLKIGINPSKILIHSNGIDDHWLISKANDSGERRNFLFIGRNERRKGMPELLAAIKLLNRSAQRSYSIHFIGAIADQSELQDPQLIFHGELRDTEKIIKIIDTCDCIITPSYAEGMPTVILEAMARGLAVIGTDVGAVSRMIKGNGILLSKPDKNELVKAMESMLKMPDRELLAMKTKSLELIRNEFLWSIIIEHKLNDFREILK